MNYLFFLLIILIIISLIIIGVMIIFNVVDKYKEINDEEK